MYREWWNDLKRRYLHRKDWKRILKRDYKEMEIENKDFNGYIALLTLIEVADPLLTKYLDTEVCIANNLYSWLQQLPLNENFAITTMFDDKGEIIQWYIDITYQNGVEDGLPFMDDLYLDIIVLPTGEIIEKDKDELLEALKNHEITQQQFDFAYQIFNQVLNHIQTDSFNYFSLSKLHRNLLLDID